MLKTKPRHQGSTPFTEPDCKYLLLKLLAFIHGDGGHYVGEHGVEKAVGDAMKILAGDTNFTEQSPKDQRQNIMRRAWTCSAEMKIFVCGDHALSDQEFMDSILHNK